MQRYTNSTKVWLFLIAISLLLMIAGYQLGGREGLFFGFLFTVTFHILVFFFGNGELLPYLNARRIEGQDAWGLQRLLHKQALLLQIPKPNLFIVENPSAFAFSIGHNFKQGSICISTGLLHRLTKQEIEAVMAHQVSHVQRLNSFGLRMVHVCAFSLVGLGWALDKIWIVNLIKRKSEQKPFQKLISPVAWLILKLAVSEHVYFENDEIAAAILKDRQHLANALWKLESLNQTSPLILPPCSSHFFIVNPTALQEKNWFLLAHPKIDTRIKRLIGYFPI